MSMSSVKTTVSIQADLYHRAEAAAEQMGIPRSHLYALALEGFLTERESHKIFEELNRAYAEDTPTAEGEGLLRSMRRRQEWLLRSEW